VEVVADLASGTTSSRTREMPVRGSKLSGLSALGTSRSDKSKRLVTWRRGSLLGSKTCPRSSTSNNVSRIAHPLWIVIQTVQMGWAPQNVSGSFAPSNSLSCQSRTCDRELGAALVQDIDEFRERLADCCSSQRRRHLLGEGSSRCPAIQVSHAPLRR